MEDRETMPDGLIGTPGIGISKHGIANAVGLSIMLWLLGGMAVFYAYRFIDWIRG